MNYTDILKSKYGLPLALLAISMLLLFVVHFETWQALLNTWLGSVSYNHGLLVFPISAYLIWRKRQQLAVITPTMSLLGFAALIVATLAWYIGYLADLMVVMQFALVSLVIALLWTILGNRFVSICLFPLFFMLFAVPFGDFLVAPLQDITANITVAALQLTGIPVFIEGYFIDIPSGRFEVAEACSGIRYVISSVTLGVIYAYISYTSYWKRSLFVVASLLLPILANGVRAYGIIMIAHLSDYSLAVGVDHLIYGWVFFGIVMLLLFWLGSYFQDPVPKAVIDEDSGSDRANRNSPLKRTILAIALAAILVAPVVLSSGINTPVEPEQSLSVLLNDLDVNQRDHLDDTLQIGMHYPAADTTASITLELNNKTLFAYRADYYQQGQGKELIYYDNRVFDESKFRRIAGQRKVTSSGATINTLELETGNRRLLVWYWYDVAGEPLDNELAVKLATLRTRAFHEGSGGSVYIIGGSYNHDAKELEADFEQLMAAIYSSNKQKSD